MSIDAISAVDADLVHVAAAQAHLTAVHVEEVPVGTANPSEVQRGHAAVAAAEAALAQAQAALHAAQSAAASADHTATDAQPDSPALVSSHLVDTVA